MGDRSKAEARKAETARKFEQAKREMKRVIYAEGDKFDASILDHATKRVVSQDRMGECPRDGDRVTLMSILAGG